MWSCFTVSFCIHHTDLVQLFYFFYDRHRYPSVKFSIQGKMADQSPVARKRKAVVGEGDLENQGSDDKKGKKVKHGFV